MSRAQIIDLVRGRGVHVPGDNMDTDQIVPARFLMCVTFDELGEQLFYDARFNADETKKDHPLDHPRFIGTRVLIVGANFGCGSSREHAPQSIRRAGLRAIVAESFADIFFGNSTTLGLPCLSLVRGDVAQLAAAIQAAPETEIEVDVERLEVRAAGKTYKAQLNASVRHALLQGEWDPLPQLLEGKFQAEATARRLPYLNCYSKYAGDLHI